MSLKQSIKELMGHSFFYALAWLASSAASIILLPIYTKYLSRADYGILEMLEYTNTIITIIIASGLNAATPRFYSDAKNAEEKKAIISSATLFGLFAGAVFCFAALFFAKNLSALILGKPDYEEIIVLNIGVFYAQLAILLSGVGFIAAKRSKAYLAYMLAKLLINVAASLYFIVVLGMGVKGMLLGSLLASTIIAVVIAIHNFSLHGFKTSGLVIGKLLKFSLPLIPAYLLATIMHNADRFLIRYYGSLDDVGIYSVGYRFPFMLNAAILQSFSYIWTGATMYEVGKQQDSAYQFGRIATYVIGFFVFSQLALSVFSTSIIRLLVDEKFYAAQQVIPYVALGLCFHALYLFFSLGSYLNNRTWLLIFAYLPAAAINVVGNMVLLPRYGYMAAAWVSTATYFAFSVILYFVCKKLVSVEYDFRRLLTIFLLAFITYITSSLYVFSNTVLESLKGCVFLAVFVGILFFSGFLTPGEREAIKAFTARLRPAQISKERLRKVNPFG